jgi:hypothetical protein
MVAKKSSFSNPKNNSDQGDFMKKNMNKHPETHIQRILVLI